ncbi:Gamma-glutamyl hydrolase [Stylosanthes scabra]|uniref:folate gamma-glutamyl hydrolase n=1 Tax=Stylosanthes scabra TaxID=79078 RepID=A0ABU6YAH4_9FABA|nr:Gamma-glutamyl hydrolase [Stylosanthes scabra]
MATPTPTPNPYKPVIGILTHPRRSDDGKIIPGSIIRTSYVKFVKSAGATAIPLIYHEDPVQIRKKLNLVNGVLLTGGWAIKHDQRVKNVKTDKEVEIDKYVETVGIIFEYVKKRNDDVGPFPLYAICLGFEHITKIVSEVGSATWTKDVMSNNPPRLSGLGTGYENNILEKFNALDHPSTLDFVVDKKALKGSIFESFPQDLLDKLCKDRIVYQHHGFGISREKLLDNEKLSSFFQILTTSKDRYDKEYVSTVRSYKYPITGFQWHPEKNAFERGSRNIPHTDDAIEVTLLAARFLVSEASKSSKRPVAEELMTYLISDDRDAFAFGGNAEEGCEVYIF